MKSKFGIFSVFFLTAIYCFAMGAATNSFAHSELDNKTRSSQEKYISDLSNKLFCPSQQSESSIETANKLPPLDFKKNTSGFVLPVGTREQFFGAAFSQYSRLYRNFLINKRKSDNIFPFHYFW